MKQDWAGDRQAVVLTSETPGDCFRLGQMYGTLEPLHSDCVEFSPERVRLTVPATYMITFITSQKL